MVKSPFRPAALAAVAATFGMVASPALAAVQPAPHAGQAVHAPAAKLPVDVVRDHPGRGGWGGGFGGGWGRGRHHDDIDGGDILAGLLVIGGIAAIASAASKSSKETRQDRTSYPEPDNRRYGDDTPRAGAADWGRSRSIDSAVDACVGEVERGQTRVDSVDGVTRDGEGWQVSGRATGGSPFSCRVDGDGRIRGVTVDGRAPYRG